MKKALKNNNRHYTADDDKLIERMLRHGATCADIAPLLNRTPRGVRSHIREAMRRPDLEKLARQVEIKPPVPKPEAPVARGARPEGPRPLPFGHPLTLGIILRNSPSLLGAD